MRERGLRGGEKKALALLGLPTFGLALAITTVTTYLPVVARSYVGSTVLIGVIGVIVGIEGVMARWVPLLAGRGQTACGHAGADGSPSWSSGRRWWPSRSWPSASCGRSRSSSPSWPSPSLGTSLPTSPTGRSTPTRSTT